MKSLLAAGAAATRVLGSRSQLPYSVCVIHSAACTAGSSSGFRGCVGPDGDIKVLLAALQASISHDACQVTRRAALACAVAPAGIQCQ